MPWTTSSSLQSPIDTSKTHISSRECRGCNFPRRHGIRPKRLADADTHYLNSDYPLDTTTIQASSLSTPPIILPAWHSVTPSLSANSEGKHPNQYASAIDRLSWDHAFVSGPRRGFVTAFRITRWHSVDVLHSCRLPYPRGKPGCGSSNSGWNSWLFRIFNIARALTLRGLTSSTRISIRQLCLIPSFIMVAVWLKLWFLLKRPGILKWSNLSNGNTLLLFDTLYDHHP